jgi:hypothetical protein
MTPVNRVLNLIRDLQKEVEKDGKMEQKSYDKYACWCESTLERKAKDISDAKVKVEQLSEHILKLKGDLGSHSAEIASLKKWIAENLKSQKDATATRDNENAAFEAEKTESEQCIGALENAIKVLTGAGTFLEVHRDNSAQVIGAAADLRRVLQRAIVGRTTSKQDLEVITRFVEHPQEFSSRKAATAVVSAAQVGHNPFGEYAPQSTQIQGILKGMYDAFVGDMEKDNAVESDKQKGFEAFIATKQKELATLKETLKNQELDEAMKGKDEADAQTERDDTQKQQAADEKFFDLSKETCRVKAQEWSERSRLRSEELVGITQAIEIIDSPEARATFANSSTTLLQLSDSQEPMFLQLNGVSAHHSAGRTVNRDRDASANRQRQLAFARLRALASKSGEVRIARIGALLKMGGHFDKVITMIDAMIALLRKEEKRDIMHRDLCQNGKDKNSNDMADSAHVMQVTATSIDEMRDKVSAMQEEVSALERAISDTKMDMEERLEMRSKEHAAFVQSAKDDDAAIAIMNQASAALGKFFTKNKVELSLAQHRQRQAPDVDYTVDQDKAPELAWGGEGGKYAGRKEASHDLLAILEMIKTDIQFEVDTARKDDAAAEAEYEKERAALKELLDTQTATKVATETSIAETNLMIAEKQALHARTEEELEIQRSLSATLASDCAWVATNFESRRTKRKTEMDGLAEAKAILAGANVGNYDELTVATSG